jgi:hypothetical protein
VFQGLGFKISAFDGSAGLAAEARLRYGIEVRVGRFEDLDDEGLYGGVWASFCLLHDTREAMPGHLARLARALIPGGWLYLGLKEGTGESRDRLYLGLKEGTGESRDRLGRRYTYFGKAEIEALLKAAGFAKLEVTVEQATGYDGSKTGMMHILARRGV